MKSDNKLTHSSSPTGIPHTSNYVAFEREIILVISKNCTHTHTQCAKWWLKIRKEMNIYHHPSNVMREMGGKRQWITTNGKNRWKIKFEGGILKTRVKGARRKRVREWEMNPSDLISCDRNDVMNFSMWDECDGCQCGECVWVSKWVSWLRFVRARTENVEIGWIGWKKRNLNRPALKRRVNFKVNRTHRYRIYTEIVEHFLHSFHSSFLFYKIAQYVIVDHRWKLLWVKTNACKVKESKINWHNGWK